MTIAARDILEAFNRLSDAERREVVQEIWERVERTDFESPPLDDELLAKVADESFRAYDAQEAGNDPS